MSDLEHTAIERMKAASEMSLQYYEKPLVICISGGKDSSVITELAIRAGIPAEFMHNHTTADAQWPERRTGRPNSFDGLNTKIFTCWPLTICSKNGSGVANWMAHGGWERRQMMFSTGGWSTTFFRARWRWRIF